MTRAGLTALLLGATLLFAACQTTQSQSWAEDGEQPATRAELYQRFGPPAAIRVHGPNRWLRYDYAELKGMTLGGRVYGLGLVLGRGQRVQDIVWYGLAPDDRIIAVLPGQRTPELSYRLWPFGD